MCKTTEEEQISEAIIKVLNMAYQKKEVTAAMDLRNLSVYRKSR